MSFLSIEQDFRTDRTDAYGATHLKRQFSRRRPLGSVLVLSDFTGASFDAEGIRVLKEAAAFDKPFVKKSAFVGSENFPYGFSDSLSHFSRRTFPTFKTRDEALAWLMKD